MAVKQLLFGLFLTISCQSLLGQSSAPKVKVEDEPSRIGWGINIGSIGFANSNFQLGLTPNIAYRLTESLAAGMMLKLDYYHQKYTQPDVSFSALNYGPTAFIRWKPLWTMEGATPFMKGICIQTEYEKAFFSREAIDEFGNLLLNDDGTKILKDYYSEDYLYVGAVLSSGYPFSTFISFHYNVLDSGQDYTRDPFDYRIGFTMNY